MFFLKKVLIVNNINRARSTVFFAISVALSVVSALFLTFAVMQEYEAAIGHFSRGAMFAPAVYVVLAAAFLLGIASAFLFKKVTPDTSAKAGPFPVFCHAVCAFMIVATVVFDKITAPQAQAQVALPLVIAYYAFSIGAAAALIMYALQGGYRTNASKLLSFCPVIYCAVQTLILYFDKTTAVNSPVKIMIQLAYVALMLMFVCDSGVAVEKENALGKLYMCSLWACVMSGAVSVSAVAAQIMNIRSFHITLADAVLLLCLFLVSISKLWGASFRLIPASEDEE